MRIDEEDLKAAILDSSNDKIDQSEIDRACYMRLRLACNDHGEDGKTAVKLLDMVSDLIRI